MDCAEADCDRPAAVELHIPRGENRLVCSAHARVLSREDGIVPDPLDETEGEWR